MNCKRVVVVAVVAALALGACSSDKKTGSSTTAGAAAAGSLTVYTSGVYQDIIDRLVKAYTATHKTAKITVDTKARPRGAQSTVDAKAVPEVVVFPEVWLKSIGKGKPVGSLGQTFAVIVVPAKNPKHVSDLKSFAASAKLRTAVCGPATFFGPFTALVLWKAKIKFDSKTVKADCESAVIQKLAKGELDAALMMRGSGARVPPKTVKMMTVADKDNIVIKVGSLAVGKSVAVTQFGAFLAGPGARRILTLNGYLP